MTKAPTLTEKSKKQRDNTKTQLKTSITQRLRTDLGRSVGGNDRWPPNWCDLTGSLDPKLPTRSVKGYRMAKNKTYGPHDDHWVILSTSNAFDYFRARRDEILCAFDPP